MGLIGPIGPMSPMTAREPDALNRPFRLLIGFQDSGAEGEAAAKRTQAQSVAGSDGWQNVSQAERNARRRGVAMEADVAEHIDSDAMRDGVNDALVGLMRNDEVEVRDGQVFSIADAIEARHHPPHRFGKDLATLHLDEATVAERDRQATAIFALGRQFRSQQAGLRALEMGFAVEDRGRRGIAEQDRRVKVIEVQEG